MKSRYAWYPRDTLHGGYRSESKKWGRAPGTVLDESVSGRWHPKEEHVIEFDTYIQSGVDRVFSTVEEGLLGSVDFVNEFSRMWAVAAESVFLERRLTLAGGATGRGTMASLSHNRLTRVL